MRRSARRNLPASQLISSSRLALRPFRALTERSERAPPSAN
jgi:hypothetical protein